MSVFTPIKDTKQKVHFSEYIRTGDKPDEDTKPAETTKPEQTESS